MFVGHLKETLEWFVPKYMSAESVSESEKKFCGSESEKKVFGSTTLHNTKSVAFEAASIFFRKIYLQELG
jgi:hypothetical protein